MAVATLEAVAPRVIGDMGQTGFSRWWQHFKLDTDDVPKLLGAGTLARVEAQVAASEALHSGEIRVCVEASLPGELLRRGMCPRERAIELFGSLRVWDTEANNGVLIYVLLADHAIEVLADRGLSSRVPEAQWAALVASMRDDFRRGAFEAGLTQAVAKVGHLLHEHFPVGQAAANPNELPNAPWVL